MPPRLVSKTERPLRKFTAPPLEQSTVETRLLTGVATTGGSRGSLSKCATRYRDFLNRCFPSDESSPPPPDADAIETSKQELERELQLYAVELHKWVLAHKAAEEELLALDGSIESLDCNVGQTRTEISKLKEEQKRTKQIRSNKSEFEALAKLANHRQPRHLLQEKLKALQDEIQQFEQYDKEAQSELDVREKQIQLLLQCMMDLKASLATKQEDGEQGEEEEEGVVPMDTS